MDPLRDLEESHGQRSLGAFAVEIYRGALDRAEGDVALAFTASVAALEAIFRAGQDHNYPSEADEG